MKTQIFAIYAKSGFFGKWHMWHGIDKLDALISFKSHFGKSQTVHSIKETGCFIKDVITAVW